MSEDLQLELIILPQIIHTIYLNALFKGSVDAWG